ncbi:aqualysin-1-like isoform X2 [Ptychodera flava]|uniref:aqualysin-1-like isoform X2 n=1 Tax=Ptychodera flava TaxID=63121 RepID=UPI00396A524E
MAKNRHLSRIGPCIESLSFLILALCSWSHLVITDASAVNVGSVNGHQLAPVYRVTDAAKRKDHYIVKLRNELSKRHLDIVLSRLKTIAEDEGLDVYFRGNVTNLMTAFSARLSPKALERLREMDEIDYIEEDATLHPAAVSSWGLDRIDQQFLPLDRTYQSTIGNGSGITVFVVDTGIRSSHIEFDGRVSPFYDAIGDGKNGEDCSGHGTHCAGVIGGNTVGVAPGVHLLSVRVFGCDDNGYISDFISALDVISCSGMQPAVVSISLATELSTITNEAVAQLCRDGYFTVVAAGNHKDDACKYSPSSTREAIVVGATTRHDEIAPYSNYGDCVDIYAPGSSINSSYFTADDAYLTLTGTSMAAPHVSAT